jgi:hypothetical protein
MLVGSLALLGAPSAEAGEPAAAYATRAALHQLRTAIETFEAATGAVPENRKQLGVVARLHAPAVVLGQGVPLDGWGNPFVYRRTTPETGGWLLYSAGANGRDEQGSGDDVGAGAPAGEATPAYGEGVRRAMQLLPLLSLIVVGPLAWATIRAARRAVR